jgi:CheY-like chemotaxis protein
VLVVDDESCVRNLAQTVLRKYGYTVLVAEDAVSALELLRQTRQRVGLVLLDHSMPGMSAQQAVQRIQSGWPGMHILLTSGYDEEEVMGQFAETRLAGFLQKPYTSAQLAEKINATIAVVEVIGCNPISLPQGYTALQPEKALKRGKVSSFAA